MDAVVRPVLEVDVDVLEFRMDQMNASMSSSITE